MEEGFECFAAAGSEFEQAYPWGVVRSLFAPALAAPEELLAGAARLADVAPGCGALRRDAHRHARGEPLSTGFYWALANLAGMAASVAVDDVQWADGPLLRWARLPGKASRRPAGAACQSPSTRPSVSASGCPAAPCRGRHDAAHPAPLSEAATRRIVVEHLGATVDGALARACHAATGGNPFFLHSVLTELEEQNGEPEHRGPGRCPRHRIARDLAIGDAAARTAAD